MRNGNDFGRRKALKMVAGTLSLSALTGAATATSQETDNLFHETLRAPPNYAISPGDVVDVRRDVIERYIDDQGNIGEFGLKKVERTDWSDVRAYNIVIGTDGRVSEDFVEVDASDVNGDSPFDTFATETAEGAQYTKYHDDADRLLETTKSEMRGRSAEKYRVQDRKSQLEDWAEVANVNAWKYFPPYGKVQRDYTLRFAPDKQQPAGSKSVYGMEARVVLKPGKDLCNKGHDQYCEADHNGHGGDVWRNKGAKLRTDWFDRDNIGSDSMWPRSSIENARTIRDTQAIQAELDGALPTVGINVGPAYSTSINKVLNRSHTDRGFVQHDLRLGPQTPAGKFRAEYTSYSVGLRDVSCPKSPYCDVTFKPIWGIPYPGTNWWAVSKEKAVTDTLALQCW